MILFSDLWPPRFGRKKHLAANGVEFAHEVHMDGDHVLFIRDCNGVLIELIEEKK